MGGLPPQSASDASHRPLRIVFMGTPALAARILERLVETSGPDFEVTGVVTRPDQPRKRGLKLEPSEVAAVAQRFGLRTLKPVKIRTPEFAAELKRFDPDLLVVAAYGRILPNPVLDAARLMPINVHASLLPRYRGAAPIEGAILAGDAETGVTIMRIIERMDAGPILLQRAIPVAADETQGSLKEKPQDENLATYTSPVAKEHAVIDWAADAASIERMTRAYDPWPIARTQLNGEEVLVYRAKVLADDRETSNAEPGTLVRLKPLPVVKCGADALAMIEVQAPGRRRMAGADFMRGRRVAEGARLGA